MQIPHQNVPYPPFPNLISSTKWSKNGETSYNFQITVVFSELSTYGLAPPNIHIVVSTHGHLDHNGGVHDFPDAVHYQVRPGF